MAGSDRHVVPTAEGGWEVRAASSRRAAEHFTTQEDAIAHARAIVAHGKGEVVVHKFSGSLRKSTPLRPVRDIDGAAELISTPETHTADAETTAANDLADVETLAERARSEYDSGSPSSDAFRQLLLAAANTNRRAVDRLAE
jgi:uncharacterized protein DUF2188